MDSELIISVLAAVIVHELGHIVAMKLCGVKHGGVAPRFFGFAINADLSGVSYQRELVIFAAGSLADILLAICLCHLPDAAFGVAAYGIFNLLPAHFLDGGEILKLTLQICGLGEVVIARSIAFATYTVTLFIWVLAVYLAVRGAGVAMLVTAVYMMFATVNASDT